MWIEQGVTAQELPNKFEQTLNENGWNTAVKYRIRSVQKYADVRLFEAYGTDNEKRRMGMAFGYDTANTIFTDNRVISETSSLGQLGTGDGENKRFVLKAYPVDKSWGFQVYIDGVSINGSMYTVDYGKGVINFKEPVEDGAFVSISYRLANDAPEPPSFLVFFTYSNVNLVAETGIDAPIKIADGDGIRKVYATPTAPIKFNSLQVWKDSVSQEEGVDYAVNLTTGDITFTTPPELGKELTVKYSQILSGPVNAGIATADGAEKVFYTPVAPIAESTFSVAIDGVVQQPTAYTVDYAKGEITFNAAPATGAVISARYIDLTGGPATAQALIEDMVAKTTFDPKTPAGVMGAVYESLNYIQPSLPTVLSFSENGLGNAWQRDSLIHYWGQINCNSAFMYVRPDAGANATDAFFAPLYFGRLLATHRKPIQNMVLMAGAAASQEIKWKANLKIGGKNVDYGPRTSNGNSSVQVQQTLGGSYYQAHGLAFMTYSKDADNGEGFFNPSQYLKVNDNGISKPAYVHSRMRVTHPNDGYLYELDNMYAMHPKKVVQKDKMRVRELGEWETIGFGDGLRRKFILSRNKHESSALIVQIDCVEIPETDYTYDPETKTITFKQPIGNGLEIIVFYGYKQEYQFNLATAPRCPFLLPEIAPYAPIGTLCYKTELDE